MKIKRKKSERKQSDRRASKGFPNPIDVWVGQRIRQRRTLLGLSQSQLAESIGLTFQQVQKYERGSNRVAGSRLFDVARVLDVEIAWFFQDMPQDVERLSPMAVQSAGAAGWKEAQKVDAETGKNDPMFRRETIELVRALEKIRDPHVRKGIHLLIRRVAEVPEGRPAGRWKKIETALREARS